MVAVASQRRSPRPAPAWHAGLLAMLPIIRQYTMGAFGRLNPEARQDMVPEVVANALIACVRLFQQGRIACPR
jgi:hypothetical protein